jgi:hypothetical protein
MVVVASHVGKHTNRIVRIKSFCLIAAAQTPSLCQKSRTIQCATAEPHEAFNQGRAASQNAAT